MSLKYFIMSTCKQISFPVNALDTDSASYSECEDKMLHTGKLEREDMVMGYLILPEGSNKPTILMTKRKNR